MRSLTFPVRHVHKICGMILFAIFCFLAAAPAVEAQENVLVATRYSVLSLYDLPLQNLEQKISGSYITWSVIVDPNNPRLAYVGAASYVSVFDLTIGREVNRISLGNGDGLGLMAFSSDGRYLLVADGNFPILNVIDVVKQIVVRKVNLGPVMGTGASPGYLGSVVVVGTKAYVASYYPDYYRPAIAVVDLKTYVVKPLALVSGYIDTPGYLIPSAAATPDKKYAVMPWVYNSDGSTYLLLISTATDKIRYVPLNGVDPAGVLVTPVNNSGSVYAYLLGAGPDGRFSATAFDLNSSSPTYLQVLPSTEVALNSYFSSQYSMTTAAINPEGTRFVLGGYKAGQNSPNPNLLEIDTGKMFTDPTHAIVGTAIVNGGVRPYGTAIANVTTTPPPSAPTVTSVSGPIVNNQPNSVTITGTNFAAGAMVRIGTQPPLAATVNGPTSLQVTVPVNAPAQANLDVIVTNPNTSGPRNQQYQSGLLKSALTIVANPEFQPQNLFASFRLGAFGVSVWDPTHGTMLDNVSGPPPGGITFNRDGAEIYGPSAGPKGLVTAPQAVDWDPATDTVVAQVSFGSGAFNVDNAIGSAVIATSVNPATGRSVVFVPVTTRVSNKWDVAVEMVDTDSSSPTFNTVIKTLSVGLNSSQQTLVYTCASTPDGKYVYVNYLINGQSAYQFAIFDVVHGTVITVSAGTLGASTGQQPDMFITPDGQSMLLSGYSKNPYASPIAVLDISQQPTNPVLVTTITGFPPGRPGGSAPFNFQSYQVVGKLLFALDPSQNVIAVFNFDAVNRNFSQVAIYQSPYPSGTLAVSPDGALVYLSHYTNDMISILDASKLAGGKDPLITTVGAFPAVYQLTVSPAAINPGQLQVTTASLPPGTQGIAYSATLAASGGLPPYTWALTSGSLPAGLTLGPTGAITGFPASPGTASFTVQVTDSQKHTASAGLSITIQPGAPLQVVTSSLPSGPKGQAYYAALAATGGVPPYSWSISSGSLPTGLGLSTAGAITGTPTVLGTSSFTVKVTDSAIPPGTATANLSITISASGNTAALNGHYAIQMGGFGSPGGQWAYVSAVVADGNGNITSGVYDSNSVTGSPLHGTMTGTYTVGSSGIGQMTLTPSGGSKFTLAFALSANGSGRIIEYDNSGALASGVIRKQDTSAFNLSSIKGNYAFGLLGADMKGERSAVVGEFYADGAGNVTNGVTDLNVAGQMDSDTFAGSLASLDPATGRVALNGTSNSAGPFTAAVYVVNAAELVYIQTDSVPNNGPLLSGPMLRQTGAGSFSNGSLNGISVVYMQALEPIGGGQYTDRAEVGLLTTNGAGSFAYQSDQNEGGILSQNSDYGQYSVATNGRVVIPGGPILYLIAPNQAFVLDQESSVGFGSIEPQAGGPFSNGSISGSYAGGSLVPLEINSRNTVATVSADGNGNASINQDSSSTGGLAQTLGELSTYNVAPSGRAITGNGGGPLYVISPGKFASLNSSPQARIEIYE